MKKLYIVRHAKSSWENFTVADFDRSLNERGKKDAPDMAQRLQDRGIKIDAFVSSPAKRAVKTAKFFAKAYHQKEQDIILVEKLYEASAQTFFDVIQNLDNAYHSATIFSHNPGITEFVNKLCVDVHIDNMPTCAVFAVEATIKDWADFAVAEKIFLFFDYPKNDDSN